ncbi:MAG TPA: hypothetical protein DDX91_00620 [Ruminococcaceae bacterium]|nr:hypothetical protein [Oscillospiraceae bacterium]
MLSREKTLKIDIVTPENIKILSANNKQFSVQTYDNGTFSEDSDIMLIIKGRSLPEIEYNSSVFVIASMKNGQRIKYPAYISMSSDRQLNLVARIGMGKVLQERRRYYKIEATIPCVVNTVERNGNRSVLESPYLTKIRDINIGGVFLTMSSSEMLEINDKLMLTINLKERFVDVEAEILRVQKNAAGDVVGYGCKFINIPASVEDIISWYVTELQRERILKEAEG